MHLNLEIPVQQLLNWKKLQREKKLYLFMLDLSDYYLKLAFAVNSIKMPLNVSLTVDIPFARVWHTKLIKIIQQKLFDGKCTQWESVLGSMSLTMRLTK